MKEITKFDESSFIDSSFIPKEVCDNLISYYKDNKEYAIDGDVLVNGVRKKVVEIKDSIDLPVSFIEKDSRVLEYRIHLQNSLKQYLDKYTFANKIPKFNITRNLNIQYYPKHGGYRDWHFERGSLNTITRCLVFMTYLNDVKEGGTEFLYQKTRAKAKKGLTLIWPSDWTHTHRGVQNDHGEKYIITGWYDYF
tara:strand:+ start:516 stop:1097 length:582 start_codon:yes stop_codon:yes gene_type:complete